MANSIVEVGAGDNLHFEFQTTDGSQNIIIYDSSSNALFSVTSAGVITFYNTIAGASSTEIGYLVGVSSAIQTQLDACATLTGSETLTNKTLTSPVINTSVSGTAILDEDDMVSDSDTQLATQQSIKKYVDDNVASGGMTSWTLAGDTGSNQTITNGNTVTIAGGTGIDTVAGATDTVTINIDSTVVTLTGTQGLSNKRFVDTETYPVRFETDDASEYGTVERDADWFIFNSGGGAGMRLQRDSSTYIELGSGYVNLAQEVRFQDTSSPYTNYATAERAGGTFTINSGTGTTNLDIELAGSQVFGIISGQTYHQSELLQRGGNSIYFYNSGNSEYATIQKTADALVILNGYDAINIDAETQINSYINGTITHVTTSAGLEMYNGLYTRWYNTDESEYGYIYKSDTDFNIVNPYDRITINAETGIRLLINGTSEAGMDSSGNMRMYNQNGMYWHNTDSGSVYGSINYESTELLIGSNGTDKMAVADSYIRFFDQAQMRAGEAIYFFNTANDESGYLVRDDDNLSLVSGTGGNLILDGTGGNTYIRTAGSNRVQVTSSAMTLQTGVDLDVGDNTIQNIKQLILDTTPASPGSSEGTIYWNGTEYTINIVTGLGPVLQVGQEMYVIVYNGSGAQIDNGNVVYPVGAVGGAPSVERALATTHVTFAGELLMATMDIPDSSVGIASTMGQVRDVDTSLWSAGDTLWLSDDPLDDPNLTNARPEFPSYSVQIGGVNSSHATTGVIQLAFRPDAEDTLQNFHNGTFRESFDFRVTSNGSVITGSLEPTDGHDDMTMIFADGFSMLDTSPADTVTLTAGTDTSPQTNYVYVLESTKTLTASTTGWPTTEHIKVAIIVLKSASTTQLEGALRNQNWNDHVADTNNYMGHLAHMGERIRQLPAEWSSGIEGSLTGTTADVYISNTSGYVYQMHKQEFEILDMTQYTIDAVSTGSKTFTISDDGDLSSTFPDGRTISVNDSTGNDGLYTVVSTNFSSPDFVITVEETPASAVADGTIGDFIYVQNDPTTAWRSTTNLNDITSDSDGDSLNNLWFSIVVWGIGNKTGEKNHFVCNLPSGGYNSEANAVSDALGYANYSIPSEYKGVGFLIARFTMRLSGGSFTYNSGVGYQDLRGKVPNSTAGSGAGSSGITTFTGLTDTPSSNSGEAYSIPRVNSGETALEYVSTGITDGSLVEVDGTPADDEYARFTTAGLEGRSVSEVITDLGVVPNSLFDAHTVLYATTDNTPVALTVGEQTLVGRLTGGNISAVSIGIADNNMVQVDGSPADDEYARWTANGLEGRTFAQVASDINALLRTDYNAYTILGADSDDDPQPVAISLNSLVGRLASGIVSISMGISDDNVVQIDSSSVADDEYARFTANGLESRSVQEVKEDLGINYRTEYIDAGAMLPTETSGAETGDNEYATNDVNTDYFAFDGGSTEEHVQFKFPMPDNWDRGTIKAKFYWTSATGSSTSDTVEWGIRAQAQGDSDALDSAWGTAQVISDALTADNGADLQVTGATPAITVGGTPAVDDMVFFDVYRNTDGTDDMVEDAWLLGVRIQFQVTNTVTAW